MKCIQTSESDQTSFLKWYGTLQVATSLRTKVDDDGVHQAFGNDNIAEMIDDKIVLYK